MSIRSRYILALSLVALIVSISAVSMRYIFEVQETDAKIINIAGAQRMLSQRIALLVYRISACEASQNVYIEKLSESIKRLQNNHQFLTTLPELPIAVEALYFGPSNVNNKIETYIGTASTYSNNNDCSSVPRIFKSAQADALLVFLDTIVTEFEGAAKARVNHIERIELILWIVTLLILLLEAFFIFRPMDKRIASTIHSLDNAVQQAKHSEQQALMANKAKSDFLANMSHELRTPMNGLFGMIELAMDNPAKSDAYLKKAKHAGHQLLTLINDVLDLSKIEAGKLKIENISFDLYQIIDDVVSLQSISCRKKGIEFEYLKETDLPNTVIGDPTRISQVLHNLLSNAIKFTLEGMVSLAVSVTFKQQQQYLTFVVKDTGVGISAEDQLKIFNKFEQADQSTTRLHGGSGLGLSISTMLTQLMDGKLSVDSALEKGSTFTFSLPVNEDKRPLPIQSKMTLNCAIVDDLLSSREYLAHLVTSQGLQTTVFETAAEFLKSEIQSFDLLIIDLSMPNIDGVGAIEAILARDLQRIPHVILVSAALENLECSDNVRGAIWRTHIKPVDRRGFESDLVKLQNIIERHSIEQDKSLYASKQILVVEDNEINMEVVKSMLENDHYEVTVASNGQKAINACLVQAFDLILMDVQMPIMDGLSATKKLREQYKLKTPIVALTANVFAEDRNECFDAGMNDFVAKPIDKINLLATVRRLISKN